MQVRSYAQLEPFVTLDGSEIREWGGASRSPGSEPEPRRGDDPGGAAPTTAHYHGLSEELYLVSAGRGRLVVDGEERIIGEGGLRV